jgi:serine/threonine protein kinase
MTQDFQHALPDGTRIESYEIKQVLGIGGFGITYKAFDHALYCDVAVKEYLPAAVALRVNGGTVTPNSEGQREFYDHGLKRFLDEARVLAKFRHPNIVRVSRFLESNGTAYMIMDYEDGQPLSSLIGQGHAFTENELKGIILPILTGLREVHAKNFLHRDIKPANIYVRNEGSPVLLDFGAAREGLGLHARAMTGMVTPGYAPFEQYYTLDKYGPWSDLYGLGATLYHCVTGVQPVAATDRVAAIHEGEADPLVDLTQLLRNRYSLSFLQAIMWMLQPLAKNRPQTIDDALRALLVEAEVSAMPTPSELPALDTGTVDTQTSLAVADLPKTTLVDAGTAPSIWKPELLQLFERKLAIYLGPIARILVRRVAASASHRDELVQALAAEIPEETERSAFLASLSEN